MDREEQIGAVVVGDRGALVEADQAVLLARQNHRHVAVTLEPALNPARQVEGDFLLAQTGRAGGSCFHTPVARIDDEDF